MAYRLTRRARLDLLDIWRYIARDSESAADRFIDVLTEKFGFLEETPYAGRAREEWRPTYRSFPVGQYVIFYRVVKSDIQSRARQPGPESRQR